MLPLMQLDTKACQSARRSRDARFDGRFFVGVVTTGIYCRPTCPAPAPKEQNVRYFASAAAAAAAGLRPCLRCRPESAPGTPAWLGTAATVSRALRLIAEGALDEGDAAGLAERLGITDRHLRRLFLRHLGASPKAVALTRRVHFAKKLIEETSLPFAAVAVASGFGSVRRFNGLVRRTWSRTPTELRARGRKAPRADRQDEIRLRLAFRPPFDWTALLGFLRGRVTLGVEVVDDVSYRRTVAWNGQPGVIDVRLAVDGDALDVRIAVPDPLALLPLVERVRRVFDLGADPLVIDAHLGADALLAPCVAAHPGLRVPGAFDPFELAVRAILGQQVSVKAAATLAGRVATAFGTPHDGGDGLVRLFPTPVQLRSAGLESLGVTVARAASIRSLSRAVASGEVRLDQPGPDLDEAISRLCALPGIGPWTAAYIALRAFGEPDAFPAGDLVLRRAAGVTTDRELVQRAEAWRPWRAHATLLLWQGVTDSANLDHRHQQPRRHAATRR